MTYLNPSHLGLEWPEKRLGASLAGLAGRVARAAGDALRWPKGDNAALLDDRMLDDIGLTRGQVLRPEFHGLRRQ